MLGTCTEGGLSGGLREDTSTADGTGATHRDVGVVGVVGVPAAGVVERQAVVALDALRRGRHELLGLHLFVLAWGIHEIHFKRVHSQNLLGILGK